MAGYTIVVPNVFLMSGAKLKDIAPNVSGDPLKKEMADGLKHYTPGEMGAPKKSDPTHATVIFNYDSSVNKGNYVGRYVRRPLSGIAIKPNTHAAVSVLNATTAGVVKVFNEVGSSTVRNRGTGGLIETKIEGGKIKKPTVDLTKAADPQSHTWTDWFLQSVVESRQEKVQITETFDHTIFSAFGQKPRFLVFQGFLMNTTDFPWRAEFWENWDRYFRATKLIEHGNRIQIHFDDIVVQGYPVNATAKQNAKNPNMIGFQFSFFVTNYMNLSMENVGKLQAMQAQPVTLPAGTGNPAGGDVYSIRSGEFTVDNAFSFQQNISKNADIIKTLGGTNLAFNEFLKSLGIGATPGKKDGWGPYNTTLGNSSSVYNALMGADMRYVKGGKTMRETLVNFIQRVARQWAHFGVDAAEQATADAIAKSFAGNLTAKGSLSLGEKTLNYFLGMLDQLYDSVIFGLMNAMNKGEYKQVKDADGTPLRTVTGAPIYSAGLDMGTAGIGEFAELSAALTSSHSSDKNKYLFEGARWGTPETAFDNKFQTNKWTRWANLMVRSGNMRQISDQLAVGVGSLLHSAMFNFDDNWLYDQGLVRVPGLELAASTQVNAGDVDMRRATNAFISYKNKASLGTGEYASAMGSLIIDPGEGFVGTGPDSGYNGMGEFTTFGAAKDIPWWKDPDSEQYVFNPQATDENGDPLPDGAWEYSKDFTGGAAGQPAAKLSAEEKAAADEAYYAALAQQKEDVKGQYKEKANHSVGAALDDGDVDDDGADKYGGYQDDAELPGWEFQNN